MHKLLTLALVAICLSTPVAANDPQSSVKTNLARELPKYGFKDVDLDALSNNKIMHINHLIHSNKSVAQLRGNIGAVLGDSLFKTLFK